MNNCYCCQRHHNNALSIYLYDTRQLDNGNLMSPLRNVRMFMLFCSFGNIIKQQKSNTLRYLQAEATVGIAVEDTGIKAVYSVNYEHFSKKKIFFLNHLQK